MPPSPPLPPTSGDGRRSPTVSVVIPALDDAAALPHVLRAVRGVDEVIVVDGGVVRDAVAAAVRAAPPGVRVVRQTRSGRGNALACGFAASRGDIVVTLHDDGSTDPGEIPHFVDALLAGADVVHGSRYRAGGRDLTGGGLDRIAAALLSRVAAVFLGARCTDPTWGYHAYRRDVLPALDLPAPELPGLRRGRRAWGDGPEIEPLTIVRAAGAGLRVVEVAGVGYPRMHGDEQRDLIRRVLAALRTLITEFRRRRRSGRPDGTPSRRVSRRSRYRAAVPCPPVSRPRPAAVPPPARSGPNRRPGYPPAAPGGPPRTPDLPPWAPGCPPRTPNFQPRRQSFPLRPPRRPGRDPGRLRPGR